MLTFGAVNLWKLEKADLGEHYRWANNINLRKLIGGPARPRCSQDIEVWYQSILGDPKQELYSVKTATARLLGWVQIFSIDFINGGAEVGVVIEEEEWGKGYGHDALAATVCYAFEDLRLHRLGAEILAINLPSLNLFQKLGFQKEGSKRESYYTSGRFLDVEYYGLLSRDFVRPQAKSRPDDSESDS